MKLKMREIALVVVAAVAVTVSVQTTHVKEATKLGVYGSKFSTEEVQKVYRDIAKAAGQYEVPKLVLVDDPVVNAWTDGKTVVLTSGILRAFENIDELALVIGHEVAHAINHDVYHRDLDANDVEAHADKLGAFIMMRAGYNVCKGKEIMRIFKEVYGDTSSPRGHPSLAYRIDQLDLPLCHQ